MALWAAFYRSRFVKDKEDKDMKDKPDRKDSAGEPVDEVEQIQREILTRCAGKEIQETSKIRKQMKNYFRKKNHGRGPKNPTSSERFDRKAGAAGDHTKEKARGWKGERR